MVVDFVAFFVGRYNGCRIVLRLVDADAFFLIRKDAFDFSFCKLLDSLLPGRFNKTSFGSEMRDGFSGFPIYNVEDGFLVRFILLAHDLARLDGLNQRKSFKNSSMMMTCRPSSDQSILEGGSWD
ncbi:hypothetical protein [Solidesulfovibrio alcoholivorans]|uniref:hypothetical protein n=1 Tax=Solidesulfovibrio alcoholivorans TaxID=81406 RepID=UPI00049755E4|nr:hypothetical protein [Solidesulfovibrio alcoholivorans]